MTTKKQPQKEDAISVLASVFLVPVLLALVFLVPVFLVPVFLAPVFLAPVFLVLASVLVLASLASVSEARFAKAYVAGYAICLVLGLVLLATGAIQVPHSAYNATTTTTTTIQPFNLTCQQIQDVVNGNITSNQQTAQTYLALYRAKGC
jgi:uncharacterized membrane protein